MSQDINVEINIPNDVLRILNDINDQINNISSSTRGLREHLMDLGNPSILVDLIMAATVAGAKLKIEDVKNFIETEADIDALMTEFMGKLESTPITRFTMQKLGLVAKPVKKKK